MALTALASTMLGVGIGQPLGDTGTHDLAMSLLLGTFVLFQRAAIGFAVAMVLRSQLAGVVVGIVLYIAEPILTGILFALSIGGNLRNATAPSEVQWYQFLPFSIGDSALSEAATVPPDGGRFDFPVVPLEAALLAVTAYLFVALGVSMWSLRRAQVAG